MATKYYLDQPGLERLVDYINNSLDNKANIGDVPANVVVKADLADYALKSDIPEGRDLSGYATKAELEDYATTNDLAILEGKVTGVYHFRGSVPNLEALQAVENPAEGDVYNIENTGMNAAWTGEVWDEFGTIADLSDYLLIEDVQAMSVPTVDSILYGGKSAVISDVAGLKAMVANDQPEVKVAMNSNMSIDNSFSIPADKKVVLDLGGNTLNVAGNDVIIAGELVIEGNGDVQANAWGLNAVGSDAKITVNGGNFTAREGALVAQKGAALEINGGTFECTDNCPIMGQGNTGNGNVNIVMNGGKLIAHITSAGYIAAGVYMPNDGSFTMNGGEIISDGAGIVMRGGQVNLNGGVINANGATGVKGKVGDSRIVIGPYAVIYDQTAHYPAVNSMELNIGKDMVLNGTDGDISVLVDDGVTANITDNREETQTLPGE
ncbi:MAG: hypothetical protein IJ880_08925 [Bacilli bacterium]|nr:hypothetical protein [Bacilli bacterium]